MPASRQQHRSRYYLCNPEAAVFGMAKRQACDLATSHLHFCIADRQMSTTFANCIWPMQYTAICCAFFAAGIVLCLVPAMPSQRVCRILCTTCTDYCDNCGRKQLCHAGVLRQHFLLLPAERCTDRETRSTTYTTASLPAPKLRQTANAGQGSTGIAIRYAAWHFACHTCVCVNAGELPWLCNSSVGGLELSWWSRGGRRSCLDGQMEKAGPEMRGGGGGVGGTNCHGGPRGQEQHLHYMSITATIMTAPLLLG